MKKNKEKKIQLYKDILITEYKKSRFDYAVSKQKCPKWLSIIWKGRMVEINGKGRIRAKRCKHSNTWFDRTIGYDSTGHEYGMGTYCSDCGKKLN